MSRAWIWVAPDPDSFVSGGNRYNRQLARALQQAGDTLTWVHAPEDLSSAPSAGDTWHIWDSLFWSPLRDRVRAGVQRDFLLAHYLDPECLHGDTSWLKELPGIIVPGGAMYERLTGVGVPGEKILVLEPGFEHVPLAESPPRQGPLRLLTVANLVPEKGLWPFLEAMRPLLAATQEIPSWTLYGDERLDPLHAREILGILEDPVFQGRWQYRGRLASQRLWAKYGQFDAMVSASPFESYGMAVREALQGGLPVFGLQGGHLPKLVREQAQGRLFKDPQDLADFIGNAEPEAFRIQWPRPIPPGLRPSGPDWHSQAIRLRDWIGRQMPDGRKITGTSLLP
jgi:glycosyltransferase involved in cell wall biosynthesis